MRRDAKVEVASSGDPAGRPWAALAPPWQACVEEAWHAFMAGAIPVGAVVTDEHGQVLARGRNGVGADAGLLGDHPIAHAELNALLATDGEQLHRGGALYTLLEPCPACIGGFYMSGLRRLHVAAHDPWAGSLGLLGATPYLRRKPIVVAPPSDPVLACVAQALQIVERRRRYPDDPEHDPLLAHWQVHEPAATAWGLTLWREGWLTGPQAAALPASIVYDTLAARAIEVLGQGGRLEGTPA
jgi:tRNA(Arg) A34 adenosine deaminase TadA